MSTRKSNWAQVRSAVGRKGGLATLRKLGRRHFSQIGKLGGTPMSSNLCKLCKENSLAQSNHSGICRDCQRGKKP